MDLNWSGCSAQSLWIPRGTDDRFVARARATVRRSEANHLFEDRLYNQTCWANLAELDRPPKNLPLLGFLPKTWRSWSVLQNNLLNPPRKPRFAPPSYARPVKPHPRPAPSSAPALGGRDTSPVVEHGSPMVEQPQKRTCLSFLLLILLHSAWRA